MNDEWGKVEFADLWWEKGSIGLPVSRELAIKKIRNAVQYAPAKFQRYELFIQMIKHHSGIIGLDAEQFCEDAGLDKKYMQDFDLLDYLLDYLIIGQFDFDLI